MGGVDLRRRSINFAVDEMNSFLFIFYVRSPFCSLVIFFLLCFLSVSFLDNSFLIKYVGSETTSVVGMRA